MSMCMQVKKVEPSCALLSSRQEREDRDEQVARLHMGDATVLVTTDVSARGLDDRKVCICSPQSQCLSLARAWRIVRLHSMQACKADVDCALVYTAAQSLEFVHTGADLISACHTNVNDQAVNMKQSKCTADCAGPHGCASGSPSACGPGGGQCGGLPAQGWSLWAVQGCRHSFQPDLWRYRTSAAECNHSSAEHCTGTAAEHATQCHH